MWVTTETGEWVLFDDDRFADAPLLAAGPAGIIATTPRAGGGFDVWNAIDATSWQSIGVIAGNERIVALEGSASGYLALLRGGRLWFSEDATGWTPVDEIVAPQDVKGSGRGFVVVAGDLGGTISWSPDGRTWNTAATAAELAGLIEYPHLSAVSRQALILAGQTRDGAPTLLVATPTG